MITSPFGHLLPSILTAPTLHSEAFICIKTGQLLFCNWSGLWALAHWLQFFFKFPLNNTIIVMGCWTQSLPIFLNLPCRKPRTFEELQKPFLLGVERQLRRVRRGSAALDLLVPSIYLWSYLAHLYTITGSFLPSPHLQGGGGNKRNKKLRLEAWQGKTSWIQAI